MSTLSATSVALARSVEVPILVIQVESPNVLYVRKSPLSLDDRDFLRSVEDYCSRVFASSSSSRWRNSLNERHLNVGDKFFALDARLGGAQWRRGVLSNFITVRGGHRACLYLMDEARSIDVAMNQILPMPDSFGDRPPLLRKVIIEGIRPCSLVTDSLTCETNYGPSASWDASAEQYCKKLFLFNPGLSDVRLHHMRVHSESKICLADLSFCVNDQTIDSYSLHLKQMRFATNDDSKHSFALSSGLASDSDCSNQPSGLMPPFRSTSPLTLVDEAGSVIRCHRAESSSTLSVDGDANNNDVNCQRFSAPGWTSEPSVPQSRNSSTTPHQNQMQITFKADAPDSNRRVVL